MVGGDVHHLVVFRVHERELVAGAVEILERVVVQLGPVHLVFRAEPVLRLGARHQIHHLRVHHPPPISGGHVEHVGHPVGLALVQNHHSNLDLGRGNHSNVLLVLGISLRAD